MRDLAKIQLVLSYKTSLLCTQRIITKIVWRSTFGRILTFKFLGCSLAWNKQLSEWLKRFSSRTNGVGGGWDQPHPVQDVAQGSVPPGKAVGTCDTHPIPWLGSSSSALLQPLQLLRDEEQTLHSLAQGSAPGVWHQRPCSVIPDHRVVAHPANNPAEIKTKRFSMRFKWDYSHV